MSAAPAPAGLLAQEWDSFKPLIPGWVPEPLLEKFRKCFFCGAIAMLTIVTGELEPGEDATARDQAVLDGLQQELAAFMRAAMLASAPGGTA